MLDHSSGLGVALRCEARMQTFCISCRHLQGLLADRVCRRLPLCFAPELAATINQLSRLAATLRCETDANCMTGWHLQGVLANRGCHGLPLCFAPMPSRTFDQSSMLWLLFGARQNLMPTVCMFGKHSQGLLANRGCCHLTLSFARASSTSSD